MAKRLSEWVKKVRARWPRSHRERGIFGDGRYAVQTCSFRHPSAGGMSYSEVHMFETLELAKEYKSKVDDFARTFSTQQVEGQLTYCHAAAKSLCSGNHALVDLLTMRRTDDGSAALV